VVGRDRIAGRGAADRIEVEADAFFERVRAAYRARARAVPARFCVIDATQPPAAVLDAALVAVNALISGAQA
jgi:dTMP kinase